MIVETTIEARIEMDGYTGALLGAYFRLRGGTVAATVELDKWCMLDVDAEREPLGVEIVGPFSVEKAIALAEASANASDALQCLLSFCGAMRGPGESCERRSRVSECIELLRLAQEHEAKNPDLAWNLNLYAVLLLGEVVPLPQDDEILGRIVDACQVGKDEEA